MEQDIGVRAGFWKPVAGFEGLYSICSDGRVWSERSGKLLHPYLATDYPAVSLKRAGKRKTARIHILLLEAFVGPRPENHHAAHLDGNKQNYDLANLAWVTPKENEAHKIAHGTHQRGEKSSQAKLTNRQADIVREIAAAGIAQNKIAALLGITEQRISKIVNGRAYK